ncbi:uncharacterized protein LOC100370446 [Saccoglossus kowalevskii]|uniref:Uncharacterized protein LOC100370446 n=1 Tax=Saccoglossus kowalevskii TaxID=10224 RepID=A0ABM0LW81_SACKO|nr:PREDICTED: uncharacterized protein LOC100370446 [Saccoglossus kowalevskii]
MATVTSDIDVPILSNKEAKELIGIHPLGKFMQRKCILLHCSLNILMNLVKARENRKYYDNANAKKLLDVFSGSLNKDRRIPAMLTLSYIVDPVNEINMIEDKLGVIDSLIEYLSKCVEETTEQSYSVSELVEGLEMLSRHPKNREKIVDGALLMMCQITEKGSEREKQCVRNALLSWGLYDEGETSESKGAFGPGESEDESLSEKLTFLETLFGCLGDINSLSSSELRDLLQAINQTLIDTPRDQREVIGNKTAMIGGVDTLMEILRDSYKNGEVVYGDDSQWEVFNAVAHVLWNYTDASLSFASTAGAADLVAFMLSVVESHFQMLKKKMISLADGIATCFGDTVSSTPVMESSVEAPSRDMPPGSESTVRKPTTDSEVRETDDKVRLIPAGSRAGIKNDGLVGYRKDSDLVAANNKAVFVTEKPLRCNHLFEINIDKIDVRKTAGLEFGVTIYQEFPDDVVYYGEGYGEGTGFWFLKTTDFHRDFKTIGGGYSLNLEEIKQGDKVGIVRFANSALHYYYNGEDQGIAFRNIPEGVYPLVAVTGKCLQVSVVETCSPITIPDALKGPDTPHFTEPFESYRINTTNFNTTQFNRMRSPWGIDFIEESKHPDKANILKTDTIESSPIPFVQLGMQKELDTFAEIERHSKKGYLNEAEMIRVIHSQIGFSDLLANPLFRIDPVSKERVKGINEYLVMQGYMVKMYEISNVIPNNPNKLPKRLADIYNYVLKPCFNNIQNLDSFIWTGSTSEGFAMTDHSVKEDRYMNDEMDVMIPIGEAQEGIQLHPEDDSMTNTDLDLEASGRELFISELERVGHESPSYGAPFKWVPTSFPGYVRVEANDESKIDFSEGFIHNICSVVRKVERDVIYLSRAKLLKVQEDYIRQRIPVVQDNIDEEYKTRGGFRGRLELLQQGPVQTLSVYYTAASLEGGVSAKSVEFEHTVDAALVLRCSAWPSLAISWVTRARQWPTKDLVLHIQRDGCHVVPKSYPGEGGDDNLQWRLSFSLAERTLAHSFTEWQRTFYLVMKKIWRRYLKEPKVLSSYHMKTTMFWVSEGLSSGQWSKNDLADRFMEFWDRMIFFLEQGIIPNFFLPENNMISHISQEDIDVVLQKVKHVRQQPSKHFRDLAVPTSTFNVIN